MLDYIKLHWPWFAGGAALIGGYLFIGSREAPQQPQAKPSSQPTQSPSAAPVPIFISGSGSAAPSMYQSPAATLPLGGETWQDPIVPVAENPDVVIAGINKEVALAQLAAQQAIVDKIMTQPPTPTPTGGSTTTTVPLSQAVNALADMVAAGGDPYNPRTALGIYEQAQAWGMNNQTLAQAFQIAGIKNTVGTNMTATDLKNFEEQILGVTPL